MADVAHSIIAVEALAEGDRAARIHGEPAARTGLEWLAILAEEFGEVAAEVTRGEVPPVSTVGRSYPDRLRAELVQVASVAIRWAAAIDRGEGVRRG